MQCPFLKKIAFKKVTQIESDEALIDDNKDSDEIDELTEVPEESIGSAHSSHAHRHHPYTFPARLNTPQQSSRRLEIKFPKQMEPKRMMDGHTLLSSELELPDIPSEGSLNFIENSSFGQGESTSLQEGSLQASFLGICAEGEVKNVPQVLISKSSMVGKNSSFCGDIVLLDQEPQNYFRCQIAQGCIRIHREGRVRYFIEVGRSRCSIGKSRADRVELEAECGSCKLKLLIAFKNLGQKAAFIRAVEGTNVQPALSESYSLDSLGFQTQRMNFKQLKELGDTFDVLLFKNKSLMSRMQRLLTNSDYDHAAMLLRTSSNQLFILQSSSNAGVAVYTLDSLANLPRHKYYVRSFRKEESSLAIGGKWKPRSDPFAGGDPLLNSRRGSNFFRNDLNVGKILYNLQPLQRQQLPLNTKRRLNYFHENEEEKQPHVTPIKQLDIKVPQFRIKNKVEMVKLDGLRSKEVFTEPGREIRNIKQSWGRQSKIKDIIENPEREFQVQSIDCQKMRQSLLSRSSLPHPNSPPQEVISFFELNYELWAIKKPKDPVIKRYKNCLFFGSRYHNGQIYIGMVWYYRRIFYYGQLLEGKKNGIGLQINLEQNQMMKGKFINGAKTGYFTIEAPLYKYRGMLKKGIYNGEGWLSTQLSEYKGNFFEGMKEGQGWQRFPNKVEYKGQYFKNKFDGDGELKAPNYYYKGWFKNGKPDGHGFQRTKQFEYMGNFSKGKKEGKGKLKTSDGVSIQCMFRDGLIVGDGLEKGLSKELRALDEASQQGTVENMLSQMQQGSGGQQDPLAYKVLIK